MSAANYLTASGVTAGPDGVRRAIFAYNHADWYVNDVLYYAAAYGGGTVPGDPSDCGPAAPATPTCPRSTTRRSPPCSPGHKATSATPTSSEPPDPGTWDCSGFTQAAYAQIGVSMPRTAAAQRNWLAAGNGSARHPRPGAARRPHLRRLLPRAQPDRARHARLRPEPSTSPSKPAAAASTTTTTATGPATTSTRSGESARSRPEPWARRSSMPRRRGAATRGRAWVRVAGCALTAV